MPYASHAYSGAQRGNRAGLAAAIAINGAVLAALFTAVPDIQKTGPTILEVFTRPLPPEPDPLPPPPKPRETVATPKPRPVDRIVEADIPERGPVIALDRGPVITIDPGIAGGTGSGPVVLDPPAPPPPAPFVGARPDPRFLDRFQPDYPPAKQRMGEEGAVTVRFLIGPDGRVKAIEPVGAADPDFLAATRRQALSQWRFRPATRGGEAVESWQTRTVRFVLSNR